MDFQMANTSEIFDRHISGFRRYLFSDSASLTFISRSFCEMTGYTREELSALSAEPCAALVHPEDLSVYHRFLKEIAEGAQTAFAEYRLLKKDGAVLFVRDTVSAQKDENGNTVGYAVLSDITAVKKENENLRFLNDTVPCGMLKYTCEKNPKLTYVNDRMLRIMRFPEPKEGEIDYFELYRENIYLMIPMEERRRFSHFLNKVSVSDAPIAGELSVLRCDGTKARLYGWVTKMKDKDGKEEFQSVCMDVTERYQTAVATETERYLKALSDVYEKIFEYDFLSGTVKYVSGFSDTFARIRNLPMQMEQATARWVEDSVLEEDRPHMREFFAEVFASKMSGASRPPQITYRVKKNETLQHYTGIFLKTSVHTALFCCRKIQNEGETDALRHENLSLKARQENMQEMFMRYTDGIAAFEVTEDHVTPLYASDNVCEFFGYTKEQWLPLMKKSTSIKDFVSLSGVDYEKFKVLLQSGEAEFTYYDIDTDSEKRIKAICSDKQADGTSPRYVMLYKMEQTETPKTEQNNIYIRTFGYFEIFIDGKPIAFRNKKAKELLALLVDRRGGYVTSEQAIGYLWEDEPANTVTLARYRKEALRLKNTLEEYGIGHIMESVDGKRRIIPEALRCDLYEYLSGKEEYAGLFKGSYLSDYTWGEMTLGELAGNDE